MNSLSIVEIRIVLHPGSMTFCIVDSEQSGVFYRSGLPQMQKELGIDPGKCLTYVVDLEKMSAVSDGTPGAQREIGLNELENVLMDKGFRASSMILHILNPNLDAEELQSLARMTLMSATMPPLFGGLNKIAKNGAWASILIRMPSLRSIS